VALIGEQWLTISSNTGVRRLDDDPRASMPNKPIQRIDAMRSMHELAAPRLTTPRVR
jgi:hypothetical protein